MLAGERPARRGSSHDSFGGCRWGAVAIATTNSVGTHAQLDAGQARALPATRSATSHRRVAEGGLLRHLGTPLVDCGPQRRRREPRREGLTPATCARGRRAFSTSRQQTLPGAPKGFGRTTRATRRAASVPSVPMAATSSLSRAAGRAGPLGPPPRRAVAPAAAWRLALWSPPLQTHTTVIERGL